MLLAHENAISAGRWGGVGRCGRGRHGKADGSFAMMSSRWLSELELNIKVRAAVLLRDAESRIWRRVDRLFVMVMLGQWLLAIAIAALFSPYAWVGKVRSFHLHLHAALFLGAAICSLPLLLAKVRPGHPLTRHVM